MIIILSHTPYMFSVWHQEKESEVLELLFPTRRSNIRVQFYNTFVGVGHYKIINFLLKIPKIQLSATLSYLSTKHVSNVS